MSRTIKMKRVHPNDFMDPDCAPGWFSILGGTHGALGMEIAGTKKNKWGRPIVLWCPFKSYTKTFENEGKGMECWSWNGSYDKPSLAESVKTEKHKQHFHVRVGEMVLCNDHDPGFVPE